MEAKLLSCPKAEVGLARASGVEPPARAATTPLWLLLASLPLPAARFVFESHRDPDADPEPAAAPRSLLSLFDR